MFGWSTSHLQKIIGAYLGTFLFYWANWPHFEKNIVASWSHFSFCQSGGGYLVSRLKAVDLQVTRPWVQLRLYNKRGQVWPIFKKVLWPTWIC